MKHKTVETRYTVHQ